MEIPSDYSAHQQMPYSRPSSTYLAVSTEQQARAVFASFQPPLIHVLEHVGDCTLCLELSYLGYHGDGNVIPYVMACKMVCGIPR